MILFLLLFLQPALAVLDPFAEISADVSPSLSRPQDSFDPRLKPIHNQVARRYLRELRHVYTDTAEKIFPFTPVYRKATAERRATATTPYKTLQILVTAIQHILKFHEDMKEKDILYVTDTGEFRQRSLDAFASLKRAIEGTIPLITGYTYDVLYRLQYENRDKEIAQASQKLMIDYIGIERTFLGITKEIFAAFTGETYEAFLEKRGKPAQVPENAEGQESLNIIDSTSIPTSSTGSTPQLLTPKESYETALRTSVSRDSETMEHPREPGLSRLSPIVGNSDKSSLSDPESSFTNKFTMRNLIRAFRRLTRQKKQSQSVLGMQEYFLRRFDQAESLYRQLNHVIKPIESEKFWLNNEDIDGKILLFYARMLWSNLQDLNRYMRDAKSVDIEHLTEKTRDKLAIKFDDLRLVIDDYRNTLSKLITGILGDATVTVVKTGEKLSGLRSTLKLSIDHFKRACFEAMIVQYNDLPLLLQDTEILSRPTRPRVLVPERPRRARDPRRTDDKYPLRS